MIAVFAIVIPERIFGVILKRNFEEWWKTCSEEEKKIPLGVKAPLNLVNYLWVSKIIYPNSDPTIPTSKEMLDWILSGQIDAIRK